MKVAVLVVSRNRPDLVEALAGWLARNATLDYDLFVVEAGTDSDKLTRHTTLHYADTDFRGKCLAHNLALEHAREQGRMGLPYDYYWVLMNDVVFDEVAPGGVDAMRQLVETMERTPRLAILSPTCADGQYPGSARRPGGGWRPAATCDYLGFMMRAQAVDEVGFLNPEFRYCWGAIHELSYHLHAAGWLIGYSDEVTYRHLGGSTYGAPGTNTISREEYQRRAKRFAYAYFNKVYGPQWPELFWSAVAPGGAEINTFSQHAALWASAFTPSELAELATSRPLFVPTRAGQTPTMNTDVSKAPLAGPNAKAPSAVEGLRLHLGCGREKRAGWVNVDVNPTFGPDLVAPAHALPMLPDGSCAAIEACHLFEHLTLTEARAALREWRRLLQPGGELALELPNLERCIALIGTELEGYDLGMISLFGYPPEVDAEGAPQLHKWGWTPATLERELRAAGFATVRSAPITQVQRKAARFERDMRLVATAGGAAGVAGPMVTAPAQSVQAAAPANAPTNEDPLAALSEDRRYVLAWPRYDDAAALDRFFHVFARVLSGRDDTTLLLRLDPERDPVSEVAIDQLSASHSRVLGADAPLDVMLLEGALTARDWRRLGERVVCRVRSTDEAPPRDAARDVPTPVVSDASALFTLLNDGSACGPKAEDIAPTLENGVIVPPGITPDRELVKRIDALHPWFYPVEIDGLTVVPGLGSVCAPEWLTNRAACRSTILVEEVLRRVDFRGKAVLDLACNCAFWSSFYAQAGARKVFGIEGRERHVEQARLYWERGGFLPRGAFEFEVGNISDAADWPKIRARAPFDVTLCAGILYHVPNYAEILRWAAEVTNEVLIVDTRVQDGAEVTIREPGDLTFNAIAETRDKIVPDRARLLATLRELGFEPEVMPVGFARQLGVDDVDSYADGRRITIIARKVKTARPAAQPLVAGVPR